MRKPGKMLGEGKQSSEKKPRSLWLCPLLQPESERNFIGPRGGADGNLGVQKPLDRSCLL